VTFHIPPENDMYYPYRIVLHENISKLIPLSIKQIGSITQTWVLQGFLQGLTSMTTNLNQQSPPLALMETL
jgi:hypothetical protein